MKLLSKLNIIQEKILCHSREVLLDEYDFFLSSGLFLFLCAFMLPIIYLLKSLFNCFIVDKE